MTQGETDRYGMERTPSPESRVELPAPAAELVKWTCWKCVSRETSSFAPTRRQRDKGVSAAGDGLYGARPRASATSTPHYCAGKALRGSSCHPYGKEISGTRDNRRVRTCQSLSSSWCRTPKAPPAPSRTTVPGPAGHRWPPLDPVAAWPGQPSLAAPWTRWSPATGPASQPPLTGLWTRPGAELDRQ